MIGRRRRNPATLLSRSLRLVFFLSTFFWQQKKMDYSR